jgi:hypothetical protein
MRILNWIQSIRAGFGRATETIRAFAGHAKSLIAGVRFTPVCQWIAAWKHCPRLNIFEIWKISRSWVILPCFLASLLSILFSGAFDIQQSSAHFGIETFKPVVAQGLLAASVLMGIHGIYLNLMLYHLIFSHPVDKPRWMAGFAFLSISAGYFAHAVHDYLEGAGHHTQSRMMHVTLSTPALFLVAYAFMAGQGWHERRKRVEAPEFTRPAKHAREEWMKWTDATMVILLLVVLIIALSRSSNDETHAHATSTQVQESTHTEPSRRGLISIAETIFERSSTKDGVIFVALILYAVAAAAGRKKAILNRETFLERHSACHRIDSAGTDLSPLTEYISRKIDNNAAVWLDLKSGGGSQLAQLLEHLHLDESDINKMTTLVPADNVQQVNEQAKSTLHRYSPEIRQASLNIFSKETVAMARISDFIHASNLVYLPSRARELMLLLREARPGTVLLLRYASGASIYRVISSSMSCAPFRPYAHHAIHALFLEDLDNTMEWMEPIPPTLLMRYLEKLDEEITRRDVSAWVESQYGEFSADIIERYLKALAQARVTEVMNFDWLCVRVKRGAGKAELAQPRTGQSSAMYSEDHSQTNESSAKNVSRKKREPNPNDAPV